MPQSYIVCTHTHSTPLTAYKSGHNFNFLYYVSYCERFANFRFRLFKHEITSVIVSTSTTSAYASIPIPMYSASSNIISYMFNIIIIPHIRADSTGDYDIYLSLLQIPGSTFSYRALVDLADLRGLTGPCSAVPKSQVAYSIGLPVLSI